MSYSKTTNPATCAQEKTRGFSAAYKALPPTDTSAQALRWIAASTWVCLAPSLLQQANTGLQLSLELGEELDLEIDPVSPEFRCRLGGKRQLFVLLQLRQVPACAIQLLSIG